MQASRGAGYGRIANLSSIRGSLRHIGWSEQVAAVEFASARHAQYTDCRRSAGTVIPIPPDVESAR